MELDIHLKAKNKTQKGGNNNANYYIALYKD
jgi:hypothetical protein